MEAVRKVLARYLPNHTWRSRPKMHAVQGTKTSGRLQRRSLRVRPESAILKLRPGVLHALDIADAFADAVGRPV